MSTISSIFDAVHTLLGTTLDTHNQIFNPYFLEIDSQISLEKSYGVRLGPGENLLGNENSGQEQRQRELIIVLTRRKFATKQDLDERKSVEKLLFEDQALVLDALAQSRNLGIVAVQRMIYTTDSGVQFLQLNQNRNDIYFLETSFTVEYEQEVQLCT